MVLTANTQALYAGAAFSLIQIKADHRLSPIESIVWYPSSGQGKAKPAQISPIFEDITGLEDTAPDKGPFPLVLVSHGIGGNMKSMEWLVAGLASKGVIAITMNHINSTDTDLNLRKALKHRIRTGDISAALKHLLEDEKFGKHIDASRIYSAGFSLGGWTALSIAGLRGNLEGYSEHCKSDNATPGCSVIAKAGVSLDELNAERWNRLYKDDRIRGAVAIDPLLTFGVTEKETSDLAKNILLIGLGAGKNRYPDANFTADGSDLVSVIPGVTELTISPAAHYTALNRCKPEGMDLVTKNNAVPVCTDPDGADRNGVHRQIIEAIIEVFGF